MIYITGDTHGLIDLDKIRRFSVSPEGKRMTKNDYLIVLGDFGCCWFGKQEKGTERYYELEANGLLDYDADVQDFWKTRKWTTLFIDGNHENHDLLNRYPISEWNGGKVHFIADNVIHLMRGQVFTIEGHTFFTMGGAQSTDKAYRKEGFSWWAGEMPSNSEYGEAVLNLENHNMKVDYVLTHCCPEQYISTMMWAVYNRSHNQLTGFLEHLLIDRQLEFGHWYFGHYHFDEDNGRFHLMYQVIRPLDNIESVREEEGSNEYEPS